MKRCIIICLAVLILCFMSAVNSGAEDAKSLLKDIHWLGHDTYKIIGEKVIFSDPFKLKKQDIADIILISHEHHDHCSPEDVKKIKGPNTVIITTSSCAAKLTGNMKIMKRGDAIEINGTRIEAVPAYNIDKKYHPKDKDSIGYILTVKGVRIYFAGDTDYIPEMKTFKNIGIAFLPVSGTYVMTAEEAVKAALDIKPEIAVPMHYGKIIGTRLNAERFAEELKGKVNVVILNEE